MQACSTNHVAVSIAFEFELGGSLRLVATEDQSQRFHVRMVQLEPPNMDLRSLQDRNINGARSEPVGKEWIALALTVCRASVITQTMPPFRFDTADLQRFIEVSGD